MLSKQAPSLHSPAPGIRSLLPDSGNRLPRCFGRGGHVHAISDPHSFHAQARSVRRKTSKLVCSPSRPVPMSPPNIIRGYFLASAGNGLVTYGEKPGRLPLSRNAQRAGASSRGCKISALGAGSENIGRALDTLCMVPAPEFRTLRLWSRYSSRRPASFSTELPPYLSRICRYRRSVSRMGSTPSPSARRRRQRWY